MEQPDAFQFQFAHYQQQQQPPPLPPQMKPKFFVERKDERPLTSRPKNKVLKVPTQTRARSAVSACDIVTLVSLLSPGGSDSEKEEHSIKGDLSCSERGPSLRKIGKSGVCDERILNLDRYIPFISLFLISVSFQDDGGIIESDEPIAIDLSNIRRASLAPLASKIRMNRPPTAPPGSIFAKNVSR